MIKAGPAMIRHIRGVTAVGSSGEMIVAKRGRRWIEWFGEVINALANDPVLLLPALLVIGAALVAAYVVWRFV